MRKRYALVGAIIGGIFGLASLKATNDARAAGYVIGCTFFPAVIGYCIGAYRSKRGRPS